MIVLYLVLSSVVQSFTDEASTIAALQKDKSATVKAVICEASCPAVNPWSSLSVPTHGYVVPDSSSNLGVIQTINTPTPSQSCSVVDMELFTPEAKPGLRHKVK